MSAAEATGATLSEAVIAPASRVEAFMRDYLDGLALPENLDEAIRYALLDGGKRLRPLLAIHCCVAAGGTEESCLPAAASVEMIHAFSLVHDDLPALDNDDLRRGKPTLHVAHGDAMAVLAGDALMSLAFQVIADRCDDPIRAGHLAREIALGTTNMIAGQVYDTLGGFPRGKSDAERLRLVHDNKTGALITAACRMGAISAMEGGAIDDGVLEAMTRYGRAVGLMFQIVDDLLDIEQTTEHLGKRSSKDEEAGKLTYPGVLGVERSRDEIRALLEEARGVLAPFSDRAEPLQTLAEYLAVRTR